MNSKSADPPAPAAPEICGIVMPISAIDTCSEEHWRDVKSILSEAIQDAGFTPQLVSDADDVGVIHKRIVNNLYANPIVVCDISAKNPNVMLELGMRLAFDKPTIIVKDDKTSYPFDTGAIEHISYPRDLRFAKIVEFKDLLTEKIKATYVKAASDKNYTTFLKHFGSFKVAEVKTEVVPQDQIILEEVKALRDLVVTLHSNRPPVLESSPPANSTLCLREAPQHHVDAFAVDLRAAGFPARRAVGGNGKHAHFRFSNLDSDGRKAVLAIAKKHVPDARWLGPSMPPAGDG
jgi:hypothetical protein